MNPWNETTALIATIVGTSGVFIALAIIIWDSTRGKK